LVNNHVAWMHVSEPQLEEAAARLGRALRKQVK
jgi:hypothetical protein